MVGGNTVLWKVGEQDASLRAKKLEYGHGLIETLNCAPKEVPLGDGPEHQRTRQDKHDGASFNYAGAQEVEVSANGDITIKTYLPAGIGVDIDRTAAGSSVITSTRNYLHQDRLGSPIAITDENGNVKERMAYDAWGKRRTLDGGSTPDTLDGQVDNRGFTGHSVSGVSSG
jgi:hypothetical protein